MASSLDSLTSSPSYQHKNQSGSTAQQPNNAAYFQIKLSFSNVSNSMY